MSALVKFHTSNTKAPLKSLMLEREQAGPHWKAVTGAVGEADVSRGLKGFVSGWSLRPRPKQHAVAWHEGQDVRPRHSPSQRGGTPPCLEGLGSIRRSGQGKNRCGENRCLRWWVSKAFSAAPPTLLGLKTAPSWALGYLFQLPERPGPSLKAAPESPPITCSQGPTHSAKMHRKQELNRDPACSWPSLCCSTLGSPKEGPLPFFYTHTKLF